VRPHGRARAERVHQRRRGEPPQRCERDPEQQGQPGAVDTGLQGRGPVAGAQPAGDRRGGAVGQEHAQAHGWSAAPPPPGRARPAGPSPGSPRRRCRPAGRAARRPVRRAPGRPAAGSRGPAHPSGGRGARSPRQARPGRVPRCACGRASGGGCTAGHPLQTALPPDRKAPHVQLDARSHPRAPRRQPPAAGQARHRGADRHRGAQAAGHDRHGDARPGLREHGVLRVDDHLHRRRRRHPALPRLPHRGARREGQLPRGRLAAHLRRAADRRRAGRASRPRSASTRCCTRTSASSSAASPPTRTRWRCCPRP
jgi:hypothetical protein